jgi:phage gp36-like protein
MHMLHVDYTQALICALATESIDGRPNLRRQMICTIALYQLGDKKKAIELKDAILAEAEDDAEFQNISVYLGERFKGTCEVLSMMPDLLNLLRSMPARAK